MRETICLDALIIGSGITGLSVAHFLKKRFGNTLSFKILEKKFSAGGWLASKTFEGYFFETGPKTLRLRKGRESALLLLNDLNLQDEIINPTYKKRYVYLNGALTPLPKLLLRHAPSLLRGFCFYKREKEDQSVYDAFCRRFGERATLELFETLTTGIYAGNARDISYQTCFPKRPFGFSKVIGLRRGFSSLVETLEKNLAEHLMFNEEALSIEKGEVKTKDKLFKAPLVISTLPDPSIPYASIVQVHLAYHDLTLPKRGFGYLVPPFLNEDILGTQFDSDIFPEQCPAKKADRMSVMMGGAKSPELVFEDDETIKKLALSSLKRHLRINQTPQFIHVQRAFHAIPQYPVGYSPKMKNYAQLGTAIHGVAIGDLIQGAKEFVDQIQIQSFKENKASLPSMISSSKS